ncbi:MAG: hypothetical protein GYA21_17625 [Myxococcales bacterium]|nr:hypothetical protein [Myxococcales bacterium]
MNRVLVATAIFAWVCACATTGGRNVSQHENGDPLDQAHSLWLMIVGEQAQLERALESINEATCAGMCTSIHNLSDLSSLLCDLAKEHAGTAPLSSLCRDGRTREQQARQRARDAGCPCSE